MKTPKIYILTAVHNDIKDTKKLFKSIFVQTFDNFEVFLVDDGSTDGTANFISKSYPKVRILKGDGNLWWTGSLNLGLKSILKKSKKEDFIWIINNDCYFGKNILSVLYKFANDHKNKKVVIGSMVLDSKTKKIWDAGAKIDWRGLKFSLASGEVDALSTKGTLYPVQVFKDIGFFDARHFPHYFSDYEFSIRAKREGYRLNICPESRVYNRTERTGVAKLSFSRKSTINPILQLNMIRFVCPPRYRLRNYLRLILKGLLRRKLS